MYGIHLCSDQQQQYLKLTEISFQCSAECNSVIYLVICIHVSHLPNRMDVNIFKLFTTISLSTVMGVFEDQSERTVSVSWGEAAILELPAILSHPEPLVIWQADDGTQLYGRKYAVTAQHQLVILSVTDSDQKAYRYINWLTEHVKWKAIDFHT